MKQTNSQRDKLNKLSSQDKENKTSQDQHVNDLLEEEIKAYSYEQSFEELDLILSKLQNGDLPIDDLQKYYKKGKLCLEHCEKLLSNIQQEVIEVDLEELT